MCVLIDFKCPFSPLQFAAKLDGFQPNNICCTISCLLGFLNQYSSFPSLKEGRSSRLQHSDELWSQVGNLYP